MLKKGEHYLTEDETERHNCLIELYKIVERLLELERNSGTKTHLENIRGFAEKQALTERWHLNKLNEARKKTATSPPPTQPPTTKQRIGFM